MSIKKKGELLELTTNHGGFSLTECFRVGDIERITYRPDKGSCQVFVKGRDFQVMPADADKKDGEQLYKFLKGLMKRPVFRWY